MAELAVIQKWSHDIEAMESEYKARWKNALDEMRAAFNSFEAGFNSQVRDLEGDATALKKAFEEFAKEFNKDVDALFSHIWGAQADKEAWQRKYGR